MEETARSASANGSLQASSTINLSVARSCFVQCRGCYNHFGPRDVLVDSGMMLRFLRYARERGFERVTLCGGDPLSRPDIVELMRSIRAMGFRISLDTVGTPLLGDAQIKFYGSGVTHRIAAGDLRGVIDLIGIPVDGSTSEMASHFRKGRARIIDEQLEILTLLNNARIDICVNTVAHKRNLLDVPEIPRLIERFDHIRKWQVFQYSPTGPLGFANREQFEISQTEFESLESTVRSRLPDRFPAEVQFKSNAARVDQYFLVDSSGLVWQPDATEGRAAGADRRIVGDIKDVSQHKDIIDWGQRLRK